jgi:hypothetical protein
LLTIRGEFEWGKTPSKKGSFVGLFFSTKYYYNDPDVYQKPQVVLLYLNNGTNITPQQQHIIEVPFQIDLQVRSAKLKKFR